MDNKAHPWRKQIERDVKLTKIDKERLRDSIKEEIASKDKEHNKE